MAYPTEAAAAAGYSPLISKITLPSGNTYTLKDPVAWDSNITGSLQQQIDQLSQQIAGGVSFIVAWDGSTAPVVANIPAGVKVVYNGTTYTGTLSAESAQPGAFYLVKSATDTSEGPTDIYDEYFPVGPTGDKTWEKIGDTQIDLSNVVTEVELNKSTDKVLGEATTFALTSGTVTHGTPGTDTVLGTGTTFTVTDPTVAIATDTTSGTGKVQVATGINSASATGGGAAWNSKDQKTVVTGYASPTTDTFVKSVSAETNKNLVTTTVPNVTGNTSVSIPNVTGNTNVTIPNVTDAGTASTWSFTMGTGADSETLQISGTNSTAPTLGTALSASKVTLGTALSASKVTLGDAITVATGSTSTTGTGDAVVTGVTIGSSASAITALGDPSTANVIGSSATLTNTQPTITVTPSTTYIKATASGGAVSASGDNVTAITSMPTSTVGTGITVGTNDKVTALTDGTALSVTKGS